ncbi:DUF1501 domain-containing protein, partial [Aegicerativicinus sediminis]
VMLRKSINRRSFIKNAGLASAGTLLIPSFLSAWPENSSQYVGKKLIVIQLSGGNDGLNTVIPYRNDILFRLRPDLVYDSNKSLKITDEVALNPSMGGLRSIYDNGDFAILNKVGYPDPNRSHFRSMDIWQTASDSNEYLDSGWIGRFLDQRCEDCNSINAIEISDTLDLALKGNSIKGLPLKNINQFYQTSKRVELSASHHQHEMAEFLYKTIANTKNSANYIYENTKIYKSKLDYPNTGIGKDLKTIAEMINSGLECQVYYASLNGFDTHNNQISKQERLLSQYSEAVEVFINDLKAANNWNDCLIMTFSEFGRRVAQNASQGTDHGKANNMFLMGGSLKQHGIINSMPDLVNLDDGDVAYEIDFRQVYATILDNWLEVEHPQILGKSYSKLNFV